MEVYLLQEFYCGEVFDQVLLYSPEANLWLGTNDIASSHLEDMEFTQRFWKDIENSDDIMLTKVGNL
jgi:hypothetical protein